MNKTIKNLKERIARLEGRRKQKPKISEAERSARLSELRIELARLLGGASATASRGSGAVNRIAMAIDESGSMGPFTSEVVEQYNRQLDIHRNMSKLHNQETYISLFKFAYRISTALPTARIDKARSWSASDYRPGGGTAMYDAIGVAIDTLKSAPDYMDPNVSFLVVVITDGEENASSRETARSIADKIAHLQGTDRWTFAFVCPPSGRRLIEKLGVPPENIQTWDPSLGVPEYSRTSGVMGQSMSNYYATRASGQTSSRKFFTTTDLSSVTTRDLKQNASDVSSMYKKLQVERERTIKDFVEERTGHPYVRGEAYYKLMKKEDVQDHKEILILDRKSRAIYGGQGARGILGLPQWGTARVTPGNHSDYDIYVQSTSVNRILPRGTDLLVRK